MDVTLDLATATWASEAVAGPEAGHRPGWLVELHLVDLPDTAPTEQEGKRDRPADRQQLGRSDLQCAGTAADLTVRAAAPAAEAGRREVAREALVRRNLIPRQSLGTGSAVGPRHSSRNVQ
jgi:hypothetical protein